MTFKVPFLADAQLVVFFAVVDAVADAVRVVVLAVAYVGHGANTLHELSRFGITNESRVSEPVSQIVLTSVIEVLPIEEKTVESLTTSRWPGV